MTDNKHGIDAPAPPPSREEYERQRRAKGANRAKKAGGTRWAVLNAFVDHHGARLHRADALVWLALFRHADGRTGLARVSQAWIAEAVGCNPNTVRVAVGRLVDAGLLAVVQRGNSKTRAITVYRVKAPLPT